VAIISCGCDWLHLCCPAGLGASARRPDLSRAGTWRNARSPGARRTRRTRRNAGRDRSLVGCDAVARQARRTAGRADDHRREDRHSARRRFWIRTGHSGRAGPRGASNSRYSTPLPNAVSAASTWDVQMACEYGALIGQELRDQGYTMSLGGGVNITREPRNGRNFEYKGEDPILAGKLVGQEMKCLQAKGIIGDIKHFAANEQETGRNIGNVILDKRTLRETDLLPFEIGIKDGDIQAVMCSYNKVNGDWACENNYLLNDFLKKAVGFKGFVLSDWGGTHSTAKAALAGLDMEQPGSGYFGDALKQAVEKGEVPMARLDDMVKRILRAQFATGQIDLRTQRKVVDMFRGLAVAQRLAERGTVLLKNGNAQLPLRKAVVKSVAVIGSHADVGVLSGGGSDR